MNSAADLLEGHSYRKFSTILQAPQLVRVCHLINPTKERFRQEDGQDVHVGEDRKRSVNIRTTVDNETEASGIL